MTDIEKLKELLAKLDKEKKVVTFPKKSFIKEWK